MRKCIDYSRKRSTLDDELLMEVVELHYCKRYSQIYNENYMIIVDVPTAANAVENFQKQMMRRFKFMEEQQVFINKYIGLGIQ